MPQVNLSAAMVKCQNDFKTFYLAKHSGRNLSPSLARSLLSKTCTGRRLQWQNSLGHTLVKAAFPKVCVVCCDVSRKCHLCSQGEKQLSVSLFQTVLLLLFNDADVVSYKDIKAAAGIGKSAQHCARTCANESARRGRRAQAHAAVPCVRQEEHACAAQATKGSRCERR